MAILFIEGKFDPQVWQAELLKVDPTLDIRLWPDNVGDPKDIDFALVWRYPPGELLKYPNLKVISSLGAGVDHILSDPKRPKNIPVVRIVDKLLIRDMTQYIVLAVLNYTRQFELYAEQQKRSQWKSYSPKNDKIIGVMGLGELGNDAAKKLHSLGFKVIGWSKTAKKIAGIKSYGEKQFQDFLAQTNILINLLPLTSATENILNHDTFSHLSKGAYIINVARGGHLVDKDLINALNTGQLSGACLDVFETEPLPADHPFWKHPKIKITPHIASVTNPRSVAKQVVENYHRMLAGKSLLNEVNPKDEY